MNIPTLKEKLDSLGLSAKIEKLKNAAKTHDDFIKQIKEELKLIINQKASFDLSLLTVTNLTGIAVSLKYEDNEISFLFHFYPEEKAVFFSLLNFFKLKLAKKYLSIQNELVIAFKNKKTLSLIKKAEKEIEKFVSENSFSEFYECNNQFAKFKRVSENFARLFPDFKTMEDVSNHLESLHKNDLMYLTNRLGIYHDIKDLTSCESIIKETLYYICIDTENQSLTQTTK